VALLGQFATGETNAERDIAGVNASWRPECDLKKYE
jgi:hypothetical protein